PGADTFSVTATDKDGGTSAPVTQTVTLTNGVTLVNGVLTVAGTNGGDAIFVIPKGKPTAQNATVRVFMNGQNMGIFSGANSITYDADLTSLQTLQAAWLSSKKLADRVAAVTDATATVHLTSGTGGTLLDDGAADRLTGAAGNDAFFATVGSDRVTDMHQF